MKSAAAATEGYREVALDATRIGEAMALVEEAGWNQLPADWQLMIREGSGIGRVRLSDGALIGTAVALPLGPALSWIGMVLVTGAERRRGHATWLMNRCIERIEASGALVGLDATPAGHAVYRGLGFEDIAILQRMGRPAPPHADETGPDICRIAESDLGHIVEYDRQAFGADRSAVLNDLRRRLPDCAFVARPGGPPAGYVLARPGRLATQIGPLVADDLATARRLLAAACSTIAGPVVVDAFCERPEFVSFLRSLGFAEQRPFTRMLKGQASPLHDASRCLLGAGPELG